MFGIHFYFSSVSFFFLSLVEEIKEKCSGVSLENDHVYMNTTFEELSNYVVLRSRGITDEEPLVFDAVKNRLSLNLL